MKILINQKDYIQCIDAGSMGCNDPMTDPTSYFLSQLLTYKKIDGRVTIYFLANAFTQSIDEEYVAKILKDYTDESYGIYYKDGSFNLSNRKKLEIVNIGVETSCKNIMKRYVKSADFRTIVTILGIKSVFEKVIGKEHALPNLLAAGIIPVTDLRKEAENIISHSKNFHSMLLLLQ